MKNQIFYIAVCDDEQADRDETAQMTGAVCDEKEIPSEILCFESAKELMKEIRRGKKFDLLILDVMMPEQDGMELARCLRGEKRETAIVFISSNRDMALQGYEVSAARYLAKPLKRDRLKEAVVFCYGQKRRNEELLIPVNGIMKRISAKEIYYIEINGRKSRIVQEDNEWNTSLSIDELEKMLSGLEFIRCHKSFLVNCCHVHAFGTSSMELADGRQIPVSKHRIKEVRKEFFAYMNQ
ncbi:LytTR family DNA-binding domain-containing protein [Ruminococcus sp. OA3]|uniref:LytR/AlgR family response regulator transcription factor n=1 Tax=Ruminococcus sp. OA3 TaxID=2914164 RepID=UPI001F057DB4|nr:LytTR family DNA-binding domain-containing protein [Ruminococcus sp. OA3]MCH1983272.1 LytTR family DNA-binding domain-containing protein [Ruminococcus sp. OA3]